ncbi:MAG: FkbM family methyltransferase [Rhodospirillaceae bacterium]|jgi:FkbM family methyltransferase|nr:FkbM family methyltransferase [Rhodospirillaceae bacterium]MBT5081527.1 FkbM family methyltransferase [Rhodospirillaceae bacterium]MBT5526969.1 FkbM family methyltransferase [Rhodospirillaceae bacterium]MBT5881865.1 FkbM family methyltransferase [Rhodospirillaceae bacterium]MBT6587570.1 FkbM family methyltransferase [Rhodospirillaceae bacterium]
MNRPQAAVIIAHLLKPIIMFGTMFLGYRAKTHMLSRLIESLDPTISVDTKHGAIIFYCPAKQAFTRTGMKGKHIFNWIDTFEDDEELWDIGANVGIFSLYSARRGLKAVAFEPSPSNFYLLTKNVELNRFDDNICSLNVALHNQTEINHLHMAGTVVGSAQHNFASMTASDQGVDNPTGQSIYRQSIIGYGIDDFVETFAVDIPSHIKIDVDGNESLILEGGDKTLSDPKLKSMYIETRSDTYSDVVKKMKDLGMQQDQVESPNKTSGDILFRRFDANNL